MPGPAKDLSDQPGATGAQPFKLFAPSAPAGPLILNSPHSGRNYSADFRAASRLDARTLRLSEDCFVDELFASAPSHGTTLIAGTYPRAYIDVNREPMELDPRMFDDRLPAEANTTSDRVAAGLGTIARVVCSGLPIYDGKLLYAEERARIENIYKPYHTALQSLIDDAQARCGFAILFDCHSMPSGQMGQMGQTGRQRNMLANRRPLPTDRGSRPLDPDMVLGDRYGRSCAPGLTARIEELLQDMGYSVVRNDPYAGGYCTVRYGRPRAGVHAIQIEINRRLYMDEARIRRRTKAMQHVADDMDRLIGAVNAMDIADLGASASLAAE